MNKKDIITFFKPSLATVFLLLLCSTGAFSQETKVIRDLKLWTGAGIEKTLGKDWKISLEEEVRFQQNASRIGEYFTELEMEYSVDKNISLSAAYRYSRNRRKDDTFENRSRYNFDLNYEGTTYYFSVRARIRYQKEIEGMQLLDQTFPYDKYLRTRLELRYNRLGNYVPYIYGEIFQLHERFDYPSFDKIRLIGGMRIDTGKPGDLNIGYGITRELNSLMPYTYYLLKLNYTFEI